MDLGDLKLFLDVAHRGSFAAAAKQRDLDPSSVSRAIAALEERLGVRLFQRTTRTLTLTEAGALYRARIEPLLEEMGNAAEAARSTQAGLSGTLRLTASVALGAMRITPLLPEFRAAHPDLAIECLFNDANLDLVAERVDLAIRLGPGITGDLIASRLAATRYRVVASPDWAARHPQVRVPHDLADTDCLRLDLSGFRSRWLFRQGDAGPFEVPVGGKLSLSTPLAILDLVRRGLGPALLVDWQIGEDLANGRLVDLFPSYAATATSFDTGIWAVYPSRAFLPLKVRTMLDFLRERLAF
jgi:DNA-binding transcriptional LysR family regulator